MIFANANDHDEIHGEGQKELIEVISLFGIFSFFDTASQLFCSRS
jgi:hypothetical protein